MSFLRLAMRASYTMACLRGIDAVILAGGQGARLRPVVADRPKVMALVRGKPFLEHLVEYLGRFGVRRMGSMIRKHLNKSAGAS